MALIIGLVVGILFLVVVVVLCYLFYDYCKDKRDAARPIFYEPPIRSVPGAPAGTRWTSVHDGMVGMELLDEGAGSDYPRGQSPATAGQSTPPTAYRPGGGHGGGGGGEIYPDDGSAPPAVALSLDPQDASLPPGLPILQWSGATPSPSPSRRALMAALLPRPWDWRKQLSVPLEPLAGSGAVTAHPSPAPSMRATQDSLAAAAAAGTAGVLGGAHSGRAASAGQSLVDAAVLLELAAADAARAAASAGTPGGGDMSARSSGRGLPLSPLGSRLRSSRNRPRAVEVQSLLRDSGRRPGGEASARLAAGESAPMSGCEAGDGVCVVGSGAAAAAAPAALWYGSPGAVSPRRARTEGSRLGAASLGGRAHGEVRLELSPAASARAGEAGSQECTPRSGDKGREAALQASPRAGWVAAAGLSGSLGRARRGS